MQYVYPAIFTDVEGEGYGVYFPDLKGCAEEGNDLCGTMFLAQEALADWLIFLEDTGKPIPKPTQMKAIALEGNQFVNLICADTDEWRLKNVGR